MDDLNSSALLATSVNGQRFLKRRVRLDSIDVHPVDKALVVSYELEATVLSEDGEPLVGEKKDCQKVIRLRSLGPHTDIHALAREVVARCRLLDPSKLPELEQLLHYLQMRPEPRSSASGPLRRAASQADLRAMPDPEPEANLSTPSSIGNVERYRELLYEEGSLQMEGAAHLWNLAQDEQYLQELADNEPLLLGIVRVLRESGLRKPTLASNLCGMLRCLAAFTNFHPQLLHLKVGTLLMDLIEGCLVRLTQMQQNTAKDKKLELAAFQFLKMIRICFHCLMHLSEAPGVEVKMVKRGLITLLCETLDNERKFKTGKEKIATPICLTFFRQLAIHKENLTLLAKEGVLDHVLPLLAASIISNSSSQRTLTDLCLRVLYNLSFHTGFRTSMMQMGLTHLLSTALQHSLSAGASLDSSSSLLLPLLYQCSIDDRGRASLARAGVTTHIRSYLLSEFQKRPANEGEPVLLGALFVNLCCYSSAATSLCAAPLLSHALAYALRHQETTFLKGIRNATITPSLARQILEAEEGRHLVAELVRTLHTISNETWLVEAVALLSCLQENDHPDNLLIPWNDLFEQHGICAWVAQRLQPGCVDDDLLLSILLWLGSLCGLERTCKSLLDAQVCRLLEPLLHAKQEDDEIVLQVLYIIYQASGHDFSLSYLTEQSQLGSYLLDLMHDKNTSIRTVCEAALELLGERDQSWANKVREERFRWHNAQWLEAVATGQSQMCVADDDSEYHFGVQESDWLGVEQERSASASDAASSIGSPEGSVDLWAAGNSDRMTPLSYKY
nr:EOG090X049M [Triops cancriformis]